MAEVRFADFAQTTIADATLSAVATSLTLTATTGLPSLTSSNWTYFVLTRLSDNAVEIVKVSALDTTTKVATIVRAQGGTTAKAFVLGDTVKLAVVADILNDLRTQWQAEIQASIGQEITRGSVVVGGAGDVPTELVGKTAGQVLMGDGTDIKSLAISGDVTLSAAGVTTLGSDKVVTAKILNNNVTLAKLVAASAQGKLLGRSTAAPGNWEEVGVDGTTIEFPAGGSLQLKSGGIDARYLAAGSVTSTAMGDGMPLIASTTVSAAQLKTLYSSPITLVGAPGADKVIVFECALLYLDFNSTPHTGMDLYIRLGTDPVGYMHNSSGTSFPALAGASHAIMRSWFPSYGGYVVWTNSEMYVSRNAALNLYTASDAGGSGDSDIKFKIFYRIIDLSSW